MIWRQLAAGTLAVALLSLGCAPTPSSSLSGPEGQAQVPAKPKRIVAGVLGLPVALNSIVGGPNLNAPGTGPLAQLLHAGLTTTDPQGLRVARVAEAVPTVEIGTVSHSASAADLTALRASELRTREKGWQGRNRIGYMSAELEALADRYSVTIPLAERVQVLTQMVRHMTDQVVALYLMSIAKTPTAVSNRLVNVDGNAGSSVAWNAHEWDVK